MALSISLSNPTKRGRPTVDVEALILKIYYDAPKALSNEDLATFLGIHPATLYDLKNKNFEFSEALKHYKRISPIEVLNSFKKLAVGFTAEETEKELRRQKGGVYKMVLTKITTKHYAPNATAGIFYLKNQLSEEFKDKQETVLTPGDGLESVSFSLKRRED